MLIDTKYQIGQTVEVLKEEYEYRECECCGNPQTPISMGKKMTKGTIEEISISKTGIHYEIRLQNKNGAKWLFAEADVADVFESTESHISSFEVEA